MDDSYYGKILKRIEAGGRGNMFVIPDFLDIASRQVIRCHLLRMERRNILRHVLRGVYEYPLYNGFLNEYSAPVPNDVAEAIARANQWIIVPCGEAILNLLKLSTQVPAQWCYISNGPYKTYHYGRVTLQFKHTANRDITNMSRKTLEIVQALKALGKEHLTVSILVQLRNLLTDEEKERLLGETLYATEWIGKTIKIICESEDIIHERNSEAVRLESASLVS